MAIFLLQGKGSFLIAGFNTMSAEKKAVYDTKALCRAVGILLLLITLFMFLLPIATYTGSKWLFYIFFFFVMFLPIGFALYANTGNRFKLPIDPASQTSGIARMPMSKGKKIGIVITILFTVLVFIGIGIMFYQGEKDPEVIVNGNGVTIKGMYGIHINYDDIYRGDGTSMSQLGIVLIERSMREIGLGRRTNGFGGFSAQKGNFVSDGARSQTLFVIADASPTIEIQRIVGSSVFISLRDAEKTRKLFEEIVDGVVESLQG